MLIASIRIRINLAQADEVIPHRPLYRRIEIFPYVDAYYPSEFRALSLSTK
jgi:hypothetical protein